MLISAQVTFIDLDVLCTNFDHFSSDGIRFINLLTGGDRVRHRHDAGKNGKQLDTVHLGVWVLREEKHYKICVETTREITVFSEYYLGCLLKEN